MRKIILILVGLNFLISGYGQLSHNADTVIPAKYEREVGHDSIFVIFGPGPNGFSDTLSLEAYLPFGQTGTIQWFAIDRDVENDTIISTLITEQTNTSFFTFSTIFDGGYQVRITSDMSAYDTTITFWAYFNNLQVEPFYEKSCDELAIYGISGGVDFNYFNPDTVSNNERIDNGYKQIWEDYYYEPEVFSYVLLDSLEFDSNTTPVNQANQYFSTPPIEYDDYMFTVFVEDSLGHKGSDTLFYQAIAVQVDFFASNEDGSELAPEDLFFSGPHDVYFKNETRNAEFYTWTFYNDSNLVKNGFDTVLRTSTFFEPVDPVTYTYPGYYDVKLKAEGPIFIENGEEQSCVDSVTQPLFITIYKSFVGELPTVVISGDKEKKFFFRDIESWDYIDEYDPPKDDSVSFQTVSIRKVEVTIYNRYGSRVYQYTGSNWTIDDAWNGKYRGKDVGSGVYYYWIRAWGLDDRLFQKKGFFHVFSGKN